MSPHHGEGQCVCLHVNIIKCPFSCVLHRHGLRAFLTPIHFLGHPRNYRDVKEMQPGEEETPSNSNPIKLQPVPPPQGSAMSPTPQTHPATGTAQRGDTRLGVIEPGSFIYTVKVTSNFLRLSCSSAIKSWRGRSSLLTRPRRGHLGQPLPGHARPAALVQLPARLGYYRS